MRGAKAAFTLAEVLITLGIIGVVAAIVMPTLLTNIENHIRAEKIRSVKYKFTKATDHMKSLGLIGPYSSTDAFVDELQKYFKIAKRCDADHLRACWPTDTVKLDDGKEWEIAKTKTGKQFKMKDSDGDYTSNNVGIITADGTPMILSYNKKCEALEPEKTYAWSTSNGKPETNATTDCIAAVFETNGTSKPNTLNKDVNLAFKANGLGSSCKLEIDGKCFGSPFSPTAMTYAECQAAVAEGTLGIKYCQYNDDYWAGAVKECGGVQNMPTMADLGKIASLLYEGNPSIGAKQYVNNLTYNGKASQLGLPEPSFWVWSGEEDNSYDAYARDFYSTYTFWNDYGRHSSNGLGLCLGD